MLKFIYFFFLIYFFLFLFFFFLEVIILKVYHVSCPGPHAGSNYLRPLLGPLANMLLMLQECSQLELALRVLVNSYGSCLQHVTSNVMDVKLSVQVLLKHQYHCHICFCNNHTIITALATCQKDTFNVFTETVPVNLFFQLYDTQELKKYNICLNDLRKTTTSSLNAVAVALLNKVGQMS